MAHDLKKKWRSEDVKLKENANFSSLLLSERVLYGLTKAGFRRPSPIQFEAIPIGRYGIDLLIQAKSGTGKTLVFTILALEKLQHKLFRPQVLIVAPTREIAAQICSVVKSVGSAFSKLTCYSFIGGLSVEDDKAKSYTCQIVVGTPGRLKQLIQIGCLPTSSIRLFVLDEADELLQSSFKAAIEDIFSALPKDKQVIATSATYPAKMKKLLYNYLVEPHIVSLSPKKLALLGIVHYAKIVPYSLMPIMTYRYKLEALENILRKLRYSQCLIFCNGLAKVELLCRDIKKWGFSTTFLSSAKDQVDRLKAIDRLKEYKCKILVSSDVAARGIDAENVDLVVNFELPQCTETYLHRAGRAGRYGSHGVTINLLNDREIKYMEDKELDGGFRTYKLPDPLPSNLIRHPVNGEYLIEDGKVDSSASDTDVCKDKEANGCNGKVKAGEELPDAVSFEGSTRPEDQSSEKQYSSSDTENGTGCLECVSNVSLEENTSPEKIALEDKLTDAKTENGTPEKCSNDYSEDVSEDLLKVPLIVTSRNVVGSVELQCSKVDSRTESVTSEICHQNVVDVTDVSESIAEVALKGASPVKEKSVKHELSSNNNEINNATSEICDHICVNPINVELAAEDVKQNSECEEKSHKLLLTDNGRVLEIEMFGIENTKTSEHTTEALKSNSSNFALIEKSNPQDSPNSESEDIYVNLSSTDKIMNLTVLSPQTILKAKSENLSDEEISSEYGYESSGNKVEVITEVINSLKEGKFCDDLLTGIGSEGKFGSYEEYDLCFKIKSFVQEYKENKRNGAPAFGREDGSNSIKHAANDNDILAEKLKDLMSDKSDYYYEVFKTYLQESMATNDDKADKSDNLLIKENETEKHNVYSENKIEQKTASKEFEKTCPKLLHENSHVDLSNQVKSNGCENSENSHVDSSNQVKSNGNVKAKFNFPKLASTPGIGKILLCRPDYMVSDPGVPNLMSCGKVTSNTTFDSIDSDSTWLPCNEIIHLNNRYERINLNRYKRINPSKRRYKRNQTNSITDSEASSGSYLYLSPLLRSIQSYSSSDSEDSSDSSESDSSSHKRKGQSKKKILDNSHESESDSSSHKRKGQSKKKILDNSHESESDSSSHKRKGQSKKKFLDNSHESDSSSDSEDDSDSSDSDSSSHKRNIQSKKRYFDNSNETDSSSDSESSSLNSDIDSRSRKRKARLRRIKIHNFHNRRNMYNRKQNSIPYTSFPSMSKNSMSDYSKVFPSFVETPYQQYGYNHYKNMHMSSQSSTKNSLNTEKIKTGKSQVCVHCARCQPMHCCMKNVHGQSHSCLKNRYICGKGNKFACNSSEVSTNYCSEMHSHTGSCYMPTSHRCHPMLPNFSCSNQTCAQWYNIFYNQWMCIQRHANLPF